MITASPLPSLAARAVRHWRELIAARQHNRILRLSFPHQDGPPAELLVNRLDAVESVARDFEITVELLSDNAHIRLNDMQGKLLCIELVRADGTLRYFTGYVFAFRQMHSDGGVTYYQATLGPWLKYLSLRRDNYLFHGMSLREQTEAVFADYSVYPVWDWRVTGSDPVMTDACQFDESDFNYLSRRWEAAGWFYWYEHSAAGHQLIVADDSTAAPAIDGPGTVPFQRHGGSNEEDAIDLWSPARATGPARVTLTGFDFKNPRVKEVEVPTLAEQGCAPALEAYEYTGGYGFRSLADGEAMARVRMEECEAGGSYIDSAGNNRFLMPGRSFELTGHFYPDGPSQRPGRDRAHAFFILSVHHVASNNYVSEEDLPTYRNRLVCLNKEVPWRPGRSFNSTATKILAPQTATVVGPNGPDSIHTDQYGRIRVQFHWDRIGGFDERSSAWVRVASPWAGAELGLTALPRVGSEVLVQWLDGNPDHPIVVGGVFNQRNMPPWELATQQALTGIRSRELTPHGGNAPGGRSNHLLLDDTPEQIQAQLKSDHACSQLSLGSITRVEDTSGRKQARGEGWELATDAWGVARAGKGLLISTDARVGAAAHTTDLLEAAQRLTAACDEQQAQAALAEQYGAQDRKPGQQGTVAQALNEQNRAIKGQGAPPCAELSAPHIVVSGPAGIALASAHSTHIASAEHTALSSAMNLSITTGAGMFASIRSTLRLFVQKAGMKLIAAAGDVDVKALSDSINLLAKLNISQSANRITISAKEEVIISGGGSYVRFDANGIEHGTAAEFVAHAASHSFVGPQHLDAVHQAEFARARPRKYSQQVVVDKALFVLPDGKRNATYTFLSDVHAVLGSGTLDDDGKSARLYSDVAHAALVKIDVNAGKWQQLITDRLEQVNSPVSAHQAVFDYPEHDTVAERADMDDIGAADGSPDHG